MKKVLFIVICIMLSLLALVGCAEKEKIFASNNVTYPVVSGTLGEFSAITPLKVDEETMLEVYDVPTFSWTASQNADTYELEIASTDSFTDTDTLYYKKIGITSTEFSIGAALKKKNQTYYWRVTAVNSSGHKLLTDDSMCFYYKAKMQDQVEMDVIYSDEWTRHKDGSNAKIEVNKNNFFGTGKNSLEITFVEEDTNQGAGYELSDGWVVYTHSEEIELYGVDAFYFNFYYAGDDADILFRVVDEDNEYWEAPIKLSNNAKQTIIIHKDQFRLHTKDTTIANQKFDFNYLKSFEIVFEHSFGDGIAYFSDLRVINYENYKDLFVSSIDFNKYDVEFENYVFDTDISEDGSSLTYTFSNEANDKNDKGIQGDGFVKFKLATPQNVQDALKVNVSSAILAPGDAFRFKLKLNDDHLYGKHVVSIRVVEEDGDRWTYKQSVKTIPSSGELIVPFSAFTNTYFGGDGFRQFYGVKEIQFGVEEEVYSPSSVTVSDVSIVTMADVMLENGTELYQAKIVTNGLIEDFEGYTNSIEMYYIWEASTSNKDEAMNIDRESAKGVDNTVGMFSYKTNMDDAVYTINVQPIKENPYNAIEIWAKDFSVSRVQMDDQSYRNVTINADMVIYLFDVGGTCYRYTILAIKKEWRFYRIPFSDFKIAPGYIGQAKIDPNKIAQIAIGFSDVVSAFGVSDKNYVTGSQVGVDRIFFTNANTAWTEPLWDSVTSDSSGVAVIDSFVKSDEVTLNWTPKGGQEKKDFVSVTISDEAAADKGYSAAFGFKSQADASYRRNLSIDSKVNATGVRLLMKAEHAAHYMPSASIVLYVKEGTYVTKYQYDLSDISEDWTYYDISFDCFKLDNEGESLSTEKVKSIAQLTIVFKDYTNAPVDAEEFFAGTVYLDEILLANNINSNVSSRTAYAN